MICAFRNDGEKGVDLFHMNVNVTRCSIYDRVELEGKHIFEDGLQALE